MKVLGFKNWYENKERAENPSQRSLYPIKMGDNIFKAPRKMLHLEMDILTENINSKNSKNYIDRFYLNPDKSNYTEKDLLSLKKIIKECRGRKNFLYLLSYDFSSPNKDKCYKTSLRNIKIFKESFDFLSGIETRGMGSIEKINESHLKKLPQIFSKQRIELIECHFNPAEIKSEIEMPFYFNPNDSFLLEKYKMCLRGILVQQILCKESFEMKIIASKPWTTSKKINLPESKGEKEDLQIICEMKYPNPDLSYITNPLNKPLITNNKITIKDLTYKRAKSIVDYLSSITSGMPIKFIVEGEGYKEGNPSIKIITNLNP